MKAAIPGFAHVPAIRSQEESVRLYSGLSDHVGLTFDPALREAFDAAMAPRLHELSPLFETCAGMLLALIHGGASDVLAANRLWLDCIAEPALE